MLILWGDFWSGDFFVFFEVLILLYGVFIVLFLDYFKIGGFYEKIKYYFVFVRKCL